MYSPSIPAPYPSQIGRHTINTYAIGGITYYRSTDIALILGITPNQAIRRIDSYGKLLYFTYGSTRPVWFINHMGLHDLIHKSNTPDAKALHGWAKDQIVARLRSQQKGAQLPW